MNSSNSNQIINNKNNSYGHLSPVNDWLVKEILSTEITPTPPDVRLDYWRNKMQNMKEKTGQ
ncbi:MAG TPA: hypothetical protein VGJ90_07870 [Methylophilaceae bacterium]|jgi:hypothetical protein